MHMQYAYGLSTYTCPGPGARPAARALQHELALIT